MRLDKDRVVDPFVFVACDYLERTKDSRAREQVDGEKARELLQGSDPATVAILSLQYLRHGRVGERIPERGCGDE